MGPEGHFRGVTRKLGAYSGELIEEFVQQMNSSVHPRFVIQLGDAIEDENCSSDRANYREVIKLLDKLACPVYHVAGNHDLTNLSESELKRMLSYGRLWYSFDAKDWHFIVLLSKQLNRKVIRIGDHQQRWLKDDLKTTNKRTVVLVHHSLADQNLMGNFWFEDNPEECLISNRKQIRKILESSNKVIAVFNGHVHWTRLDVHNSIPYFTVQSLVENTRNNGKPSNSYAIVQIGPDYLKVRVSGRNRQTFIYRV